MAAAPPPCSSCSCSCRIRGRKQAPARRALPTVASLVPCFLLLLLVVASCQPALVSAAHGGGGGGGRKHAAAAARAHAHAQQTLFRAAGDEREEAYRRVMARMARMDRDSNMTIQVIFPFPAVSYSTPFPTNLYLLHLSPCARASCRLRPPSTHARTQANPPLCRLFAELRPAGGRNDRISGRAVS
jgi:hypothetical protein